MQGSFRARAWVLVLTWLLLPVFAHAEPTAAQPPLPTVDLQIGKAHFTAEVARTPAQTECGLMFRRQMADNAGMLFFLGAPQQACFWMENTFLPLSVAYLDQTGRIIEIHDMKPFDRTPIYSKSHDVVYALEANQGWFVLNKIPPGTLVQPVLGTLSSITAPPTVPAPAAP